MNWRNWKMERTLRIRKDEPLYKWIERLASHYRWTEEVREAVSEVSKTSYIHGSRDAQEMLKKYGRI